MSTSKKKREIKLKDRFGIYLLFATLSNIVVFLEQNAKLKEDALQSIDFLSRELAFKLKLYYRNKKLVDEYRYDSEQAFKQLDNPYHREPLSVAVSLCIYYLEEVKKPIFLSKEFRQTLYEVDLELFDEYKDKDIYKDIKKSNKLGISVANAYKNHLQSFYDGSL